VAIDVCTKHHERFDPDTRTCALCDWERDQSDVSETTPGPGLDDMPFPKPELALASQASTERTVSLQAGGDDSETCDAEVALPSEIFVEDGIADGAATTGSLAIQSNPSWKPDMAPELAISASDRGMLDKLRAVRDRGLFPVLFFGYGGAGKTWLLHRLKQQLGQFPYSFPCDPVFQELTDHESERVELRTTSDVEIHYVYANKTFVLIDVPGDWTYNLLEQNYAELRRLVTAMHMAKAIIVCFPADLMVLGELIPEKDEEFLDAVARRIAEAAIDEDPTFDAAEYLRIFRNSSDDLDRFGRGVFRVAAMLEYLKQQRIDPFEDEQYARLVPEAIEEFLMQDRGFVGGKDGLDCPTFFALTKADRLLSACGFRDQGDKLIVARTAEMERRAVSAFLKEAAAQANNLAFDDPWAMLFEARKDLHAQLVSHFPLSKFDFVTAFYGHDGQDSLLRTHYRRHPPHGVVEMIEWIMQAKRLRNRPRLFRRHYGLAARARRKICGIRRGVIKV
jgi:GTPase SAR1 family protein